MAAAKDTVRIQLPRAGKDEEKIVFVGVNGKGYAIERGKEVEVPLSVAEVLRNSEAFQDKLEAFLEDNKPKT